MIVNVKVVEGERSRLQAYEGVCIARSGGGINQSFTVRKISYGEGVERVFPLYSPLVDSIKVVRRGKVRRAKLYYLRGLRGKRRASPRSRKAARRGRRVSPALRSAGVKSAYGLSIPATLAEAVRPDTTALIVYDMQVGILRQLKHGPDVLARVLEGARAGARGRRAHLLHAPHVAADRSSRGVFQTRQMMFWQSKYRRPTRCSPGSCATARASQLAPELARARRRGDPRQDHACRPSRARRLRSRCATAACQSFVICGIATEIGIEPTVRHGADLGFIPVVVEDACGAGEPRPASARSPACASSATR